MEKYSVQEFTNYLKQTNNPNLMKKIKSTQKFYSLSNFVYKITFEDDTAVVLKIANLETENLLIFNKDNMLKVMQEMNFSKEIFIYFGQQFDVESFVHSKNLGQQDFLNKKFRQIITKRIAEFNALGFGKGDNNIWTLMHSKNILSNIILAIRSEMITFTNKNKLTEQSDVNKFVDSLWIEYESNKYIKNVLDENFAGNYLNNSTTFSRNA